MIYKHSAIVNVTAFQEAEIASKCSASCNEKSETKGSEDITRG